MKLLFAPVHQGTKQCLTVHTPLACGSPTIETIDANIKLGHYSATDEHNWALQARWNHAMRKNDVIRVTTSKADAMMYLQRYKLSIVILAISVLALPACTSSLVLGTAYNAAARKTADRVKSYADFDAAQQQSIEEAFQSFHQWHRVAELPTYSAILNNVAGTLKSNQTIEQTQLHTWFETIQQRSLRARACSPLSGAAGFLTEMTDWQIQQLHEKLKSNRMEQYEKYKDESTDERKERRREMMITWASRAGIDMNDRQKQLLDTTLDRQTSMGDRRNQLWNDWTDEFVALLQTRQSEQFPVRVQSHIDSLWNITERHFPEEWEQNRELWQNFFQELLNDLTVDQKSMLVGKITSIAESISTLSNKKSRNNPVCYSD